MKNQLAVNNTNHRFTQLYDAVAERWHESKTLWDTRTTMIMSTWLLHLEETRRRIDLEIGRIRGLPDDEL